MIKVVFSNLEKSELAKEAVHERMSTVIEKFPDVDRRGLTVTLSMDNSPVQAGPDLFRVRVQFSSGKYGGIMLEKSASNMYVALASVVDRMHERLNRHAEKNRSLRRSIRRKAKVEAQRQMA